MTKIYCDICGEEVKIAKRLSLPKELDNDNWIFKGFDVCSCCENRLSEAKTKAEFEIVKIRAIK